VLKDVCTVRFDAAPQPERASRRLAAPANLKPTYPLAGPPADRAAVSSARIHDNPMLGKSGGGGGVGGGAGVKPTSPAPGGAAPASTATLTSACLLLRGGGGGGGGQAGFVGAVASSHAVPSCAEGMADMTISAPMAVKHAVHVEYDAKTGTYNGLPSAWAPALPAGE